MKKWKHLSCPVDTFGPSFRLAQPPSPRHLHGSPPFCRPCSLDVDSCPSARVILCFGAHADHARLHAGAASTAAPIARTSTNHSIIWRATRSTTPSPICSSTSATAAAATCILRDAQRRHACHQREVCFCPPFSCAQLLSAAHRGRTHETNKRARAARETRRCSVEGARYALRGALRALTHMATMNGGRWAGRACPTEALA